ncbi:unnamed protein product, partial [Darwinula stevensoni]
MCMSGCPYKKIYYNWQSGKAEKCTLCYPRLENGEPTVCSETCVGRIRYLGVVLYDADQISTAAGVTDEQELYEAQLKVFLNPHDPKVIAQAKADGIADNWLEAAKQSPVYKMAIDWKVAFPLHPEYRTLPMVWYIPPLSPLQAAAQAGKIPSKDGIIPDIDDMRIPVKYLANLLTGGKEAPVRLGLKRMLAMRRYMRSKLILGQADEQSLQEVNLSTEQVQDMYNIMAIANYEDRFVIPTGHREESIDAYGETGACGFSFGNGCASHSNSKTDLFEQPITWRGLLLTYPTQPLLTALPECAAILEQEGWLPKSTVKSLKKVIEQFEQQPLMTLQEAYVDLFDRTPSLSLHLFEHVYGESRERGQALVDLAELYREKGLVIATEELPDYLPLFLEYLALL